MRRSTVLSWCSMCLFLRCLWLDYCCNRNCVEKSSSSLEVIIHDFKGDSVVLPLLPLLMRHKYDHLKFALHNQRQPRHVQYRGCTSGLYYKHITIINDNSIMTLQVVASPTIVILMTLEVSFMLLANIYSRGITHEDCHVTIVIYLQYRPQAVSQK